MHRDQPISDVKTRLIGLIKGYRRLFGEFQKKSAPHDVAEK